MVEPESSPSSVAAGAPSSVTSLFTRRSTWHVPVIDSVAPGAAVLTFAWRLWPGQCTRFEADAGPAVRPTERSSVAAAGTMNRRCTRAPFGSLEAADCQPRAPLWQRPDDVRG